MSKVVTEELETETVSPEYIKRKARKGDTISCSRKIDLNEHVCEGLIVTQSQVIVVDEAVSYDKCIIPYKMSNATEESQVFNVDIGAKTRGVQDIAEIDQVDQLKKPRVRAKLSCIM